MLPRMWCSCSYLFTIKTAQFRTSFSTLSRTGYGLKIYFVFQILMNVPLGLVKMGVLVMIKSISTSANVLWAGLVYIVKQVRNNIVIETILHDKLKKNVQRSVTLLHTNLLLCCSTSPAFSWPPWAAVETVINLLLWVKQRRMIKFLTRCCLTLSHQKCFCHNCAVTTRSSLKWQSGKTTSQYKSTIG